jgi:hypothetical protein
MFELDGSRSLGIAQVCGRESVALEPGAEVRFYAEFHFDTGDRYRADGAAHVLTTGVPAPSVVIAACALRLVDGPDGLLGSVATSASLFNPTDQPGTKTGSIWRLVACF